MLSVGRRRLLRTTGGVGLALGSGAASAEEFRSALGGGTVSAEAFRAAESMAPVVTTVTVTATGGFLAVNTGDPTVNRFSFADLDTPAVEFEAALRSDGTWSADTISFASPSLAELGISGINLDVELDAPSGLVGTLDRETGAMTAAGTIELTIPLSEIGEASDITVSATIGNATTGQSENLSGSPGNLGGAAGSVTLVDNEFSVPATGAVLRNTDVDAELGLPADQPGRNWLELDLELAFQELQPELEFTATGKSGVIAINTDDPDADGYTLPENLGQPPVQFDAEVYQGGGWVSKNVSFAPLSPGDIGLPGTIDLEIDINAPEGLVGTLDREAGLLTLAGVLEIFLPLSEVDSNLDDVTVVVAIENGTTGQSENMTGDPGDLRSEQTTVTVVDNEFSVPAVDTTIFGIDVDEVLGLPSTQVGRNWFELELEVAFAEAVGQPPRLPGQFREPQDLDADGLFEDVNGDGRFSITDVQVLFANLESNEVQNNAQAFAFAGGDEVDIGDVVELFRRL